MSKKALQCSKMFDSVNGTVVRDVVIFIEGDRITSVEPAATAKLDGCEVIDLTGKFVTPGLIDCHMHIGMNGAGSSLGTKPYTSLGDATMEGLTNVYSDLMAGFTSVRTCGDMGYSDVAIRNAINRGDFAGPRMMVAGSNLSSTGGHSDTHYNPYLHEVEVHSGVAGDGPTEMVKLVRTNIKHGVDFIKFMATGGVMSLGTTVGAQQMSYEEMKAICDTAKMYGMITATHAHGTSGIKDAIRAGVTSVEHGMMMDEEGIQLMKEHGTTLVPTIIAAERIIVKGKEAGTPDWAIAKAKQVYDRAHWGFTRCMEEGIPIAFGTDSGTPYNFHGKQAYEFELMVGWGMTPLQALTAATKTASELLRKQDEVGSIEADKYADVVAFDGDPTEDIKVMTNCTFVMKGGEVYKA
ncbi:metal-dependent hydrolase family protein [Merdimmobilis hominis]|uniref:metal-dependent hydrolase family protein n=1 Tax=Merdimmobilis hominis TaxID=2897707 RepID=UPI0018998507|nr:amidohydrolase family protein [Merdimmobilis hominis]